jgi:acetyl esterase/lipase
MSVPREPTRDIAISYYDKGNPSLPPSAFRMRPLAFFVFTSLLTFQGLIASAEEVRRTEDVIYGRKHGMALTMDVFQPQKPNGCGLMFLVNGGWLSSKDTPLMVTIRPSDYEEFLKRGYTVFAVVTSSQPRFQIADEIQDVHRAARFIKFNAKRFGIDPKRVGVLGASSGGHLTLSLAARGGPGKADATDPIERESSAVQAAACFFPPTDFLNYGGEGIDGLGAGPLAPLEVAFGAKGLLEEDRIQLSQQLSPIYGVTDRLPPTLIIHGDKDEVVPLQQAQRFAERAKEVGAPPVKLIVRPGKGHGWGDFWKSAEDISAFADWFDEHLRK